MLVIDSNDMSMKKLMIMLALVPFFASCLWDDSDVRPVDELALQKYLSNKRYEIVDMPLELMEISLELDAYLQLPEDQKMNDPLFFGNVFMHSEGQYVANIYYAPTNSYVDMVVETGGKSLWEEGAQWKIAKFDYSPGYYPDMVNYGEYQVPDDAVTVTMSVADSTWAFSAGEHTAVLLKMHPKNGERHTWTVEAQGKESGSGGYTSEFGTVGQLLVREHLDSQLNVANVFDGKFNVSIYRDGKPYDYCFATYQYDLGTTFQTSR